MARREYKGGAERLLLASGILTTTTATGDFATTATPSAKWPTGAVGKFVVVVDRGLSTEEKVLVTSLSGSTFTVGAGGRGYDGTTNVSHSANANIEHSLSAVDLDEANKHINDTGDDDHTQYLNTARHDVTARHGTSVVDMAAVTAVITPPGMMTPYGGSSAPTGWLLCDGAAVSRTTYAALFTAIGTAFGAGDGSTTFNVPDTRDRLLVGAGSTHTRGTAYSDTHAHTIGTLAAVAEAAHVHSVSVTSGASSSADTGSDSPNHTHNTFDGTTPSTTGGVNQTHVHAMGHTHGVSGNSAATSHNHSLSGAPAAAAAGTALATQFIIKT